MWVPITGHYTGQAYESTQHWLFPVAFALACAAGLSTQTGLEPVTIRLPSPGVRGNAAESCQHSKFGKAVGQGARPVSRAGGSKNVATGKKVTSSETDPVVGDLTLITDGDTTQIEGNNVELGRGVQWIIMDLEGG